MPLVLNKVILLQLAKPLFEDNACTCKRICDRFLIGHCVCLIFNLSDFWIESLATAIETDVKSHFGISAIKVERDREKFKSHRQLCQTYIAQLGPLAAGPVQDLRRYYRLVHPEPPAPESIVQLVLTLATSS